jgi:putative ABC transport system permease protein
MTTEILTLRQGATGGRVPPIFTLALRELRGGLRGFHIFVACLALGVAVITGVGALADSLRAGFERQGQSLLGGDVALSRPHRRLEPQERAWLTSRGVLSEVVTLRAMARRLDLSEQTLVEIKGVDHSYPLVGTVKLSDGIELGQAIGTQGVAVDPILLERLALKIGDRLSIGRSEVVISATVEAEPDKLTDRLTYGPRVLLSIDTLERTGLLDPGSLVTWRAALKLGEGDASAADLMAFRLAIKQALPEAGWTLRDRRDPSPQVTKTLERLRQFLTLVGLTALIVGGVGVANAVATFIDRRRRVIAAFKSLGATSRVIFGVHLTQVLLIAAVGIVIGLLVGFLIPALLTQLYGDMLPIRAEITTSLHTLMSAAGYGFLVSLLFTLWPLGRAELVRPSVLFRDEVAPERVVPRRSVLALLLAAALILIALAVFSAEAQRLAFYYCLGVIGVFAIFLGLGELIGWAARNLPRPRWPELALAVGNLGAPGALTRSVVLSLGAGLSLLIAVALTDRSIVAELTGHLPAESPTYFILDLKRAELAAFEALVRDEVPAAKVYHAPMLRGRIVQLAGTPVDQVKAPPEVQWVLNGDRGLSYADVVPDGSHVVAGEWWPKDYAGEPLVSFEAEVAKGLGLKIGDTVTINVLGRNIVARISNLRDVKWESLAINFVMVFTPNTLLAAPHNLLATVTLPKDAPLSQEALLARRIGSTFPATTAIRVKDAINAFNTIFARVMTAVRVAGSVTLLAGALVLAGALATAQRRRIKQAVILKTLGATRYRILLSHLLEYMILAILTSFISLGLGTAAASITVSRVMEIEFVFSVRAIFEALVVAIGLVVIFGGFGTWRVLNARPVPYLRSE